jgi:hypothetical protein
MENNPSFLSRFGGGLLNMASGGAYVNTINQNRALQEKELAAQQEAQAQQEFQALVRNPNLTPEQKLQEAAKYANVPGVMEYIQAAMKPQELPASVREFQAVQALPAEQRQAFQDFRNPITPFQREQLALDRAKLESGADYQRTQATQRAQQLELQARALEQAGRRQEAAALRQEAQVMVEGTQEPKMFNYGRVPDPLARINDPKRRDIEVSKLGSEADKTIRAQDEFIRAAQDEKTAMETFEAAMNRQGGSGGASRFLPDFVAGFDPEIADMMQSSAFMVPKMREPGSGATSDFDAKMFEKATIGREKPTETNQRIIQARKAAADNVIAKADFLEAFRADNGHVRGAEAAWRRYLNDNPIFDKSNAKDMALNPNRRDWREYFGGQQEAGGATPEATGGITLPPASAIEAELRRRGAM